MESDEIMMNSGELVSSMYNCWLKFKLCDEKVLDGYKAYFKYIVVKSNNRIISNAANELKKALSNIKDVDIEIIGNIPESNCIFVGTLDDFKAEGFNVDLNDKLKSEGFALKILEGNGRKVLSVIGGSEKGVLYGAFHLIRSIFSGKNLKDALCIDNPQNAFRILNHWDNMDGNIERGYAGKSIFFKDNRIVDDLSRIKDYARLLASIAINGVVINNVNVHLQ
ncbi:MAG: alpha-glucuronidase [Thermoanaerobacterium sp.]|nr:alpha-glucuronidase [Thermoanaerobacterium sp.]